MSQESVDDNIEMSLGLIQRPPGKTIKLKRINAHDFLFKNKYFLESFSGNVVKPGKSFIYLTS